jgi:hypothetical protein
MLGYYQGGLDKGCWALHGYESTKFAPVESGLYCAHPKEGMPKKVSDYMPISLIHNFPKLISKILANRLASEIKHLISLNQTTFIKTRCIHDSFAYVHGVIKKLHKRHTAALFLKLEISKTFDTVSWSYLLDILSHLDFGQKWRNWMSSLWGTTSSSVLVNGQPRDKILHYRGVRQRIPISNALPHGN